MRSCQELVNSYIEWLRGRISVEDLDGVCEITTPFLDRHNDRIQIYVKSSSDANIVTITDDGYTITDLRMTGCDLNTDKRQRILRSILNGFGVQLEKDELFVTSAPSNFPQKKHNLIQAILSIDDLFVLAQPTVANIFREDVESFLDLEGVRFIPSVNFTGRTGYVHYFDFAIPASRDKPERIVRAINRPNKDNISSLLFSWQDTQDVRPPRSTAYAVLNDTERQVYAEHITALQKYDIEPVLWSQRSHYAGELAA